MWILFFCFRWILPLLHVHRWLFSYWCKSTSILLCPLFKTYLQQSKGEKSKPNCSICLQGALFIHSIIYESQKGNLSSLLCCYHSSSAALYVSFFAKKWRTGLNESTPWIRNTFPKKSINEGLSGFELPNTLIVSQLGHDFKELRNVLSTCYQLCKYKTICAIFCELPILNNQLSPQFTYPKSWEHWMFATRTNHNVLWVFDITILPK